MRVDVATVCLIIIRVLNAKPLSKRKKPGRKARFLCIYDILRRFETFCDYRSAIIIIKSIAKNIKLKILHKHPVYCRVCLGKS
jgi:hypothetical protein